MGILIPAGAFDMTKAQWKQMNRALDIIERGMKKYDTKKISGKWYVTTLRGKKIAGPFKTMKAADDKWYDLAEGIKIYKKKRIKRK